MDHEKIYTPEELNSELNENQKKFCHQFIIRWNRVQSYMLAYPECEYKSASASATRLLEDVRIKQYIELIQKDLAKESGISPLSQILELKKIAYGNIADFYNDWGKLKPFNELNEDQKAMLQEISHNVSRVKDSIIDVEFVKLKGADKRAAIQEINKMLGYYKAEVRDIKITGEVSGFLPNGFED